jgi:glyoxylase-like metal-dependent hydrolase (beta-lactamase superfamily II)
VSVDRVPVPVATRAPGGETNAYVAGDVLVDPPASHPALDAALEGRSVAHVVVTHAHPDHVGGVAAYADRLDATVWARAGYADRLADAAGIEPDRTFGDGDPVGAATALATPGHAPDHAAFAAGDAVCCGDLAVADGSVAVAAPDGDLRAYLDSLRRLRERDPRVLYPGHGPVVEDPAATVDRLLAHRRDREERVLAAVRDGAREVETVLEEAYDGDLSGVRDLARATVVAHLVKLDAEGLVRWDRGAGRAVAVTDPDRRTGERTRPGGRDDAGDDV